MDRLARLARWFGGNPAAQLVLGGLVVTLAFPATPAGTLARFICFGALGVLVSRSWRSLPDVIREPTPRQALAIALTVVGTVWLTTYWPMLAHSPSPEWQIGDWGPQHAVLAKLMPHFPGLDVPVWNHDVSTGDAPLELYPALTYLFTGHVAWLLGLENDLPHAFMIVAALVQLGLALTTTALASRVAPKPIAVIVGLFWLVDSGALSHGGVNGLFRWALLHSAFGHVFSMIAALGILSALMRPRLGASVTIWVATAVATAAHPAGLISASTYAVALLAVALLASDVPKRRALAVLGHLVLGLALGAVVWMPSAERLVLYGQHYPNQLYGTVAALQMLMQHAMPMTSYGVLVFISYLGVLIGPWTRRAEVIFIAIVTLALLLGLCDSTYLALGLAPGKAVARLGVIRLMMLVRPFTYACTAYVIATLYRHARAAWQVAPRRRSPTWIAPAILGIFLCTFARVAPPWWAAETDRAVGEANQFVPDLESQLALEAWATEQMASATTPQTWGRALFESQTHEHFHLTARTGMPSFHLAPIPDLLLRERIEDRSPESLARFNVRWVIALGASPSIGDPSSERTVGNYRVREVRDWDGKLARIESGSGSVVVVRLDDDLVEIDVKAPGPVLVALGMGYYPRWRAQHGSGAIEPVYAMPSIQGGKLHVVSAWVAPGRTTFTCDGSLPSDGRGRIVSLVAALLAIAGVIVWTVPRWRWRTLRTLARGRAWLVTNTGRVLELAVPVIVAGLFAVGFITERGGAGAILVGSSGIRAVATVEARVGDGGWSDCSYSALTGTYRCHGVVSVYDGTITLLNDQPPSWAFITPAITAMPESGGVEVRITRRLRLAGRYWLGTSKGTATIQIGTEITHEFGQRSGIDIPSGTYTVVVTARTPASGPVSLTVVNESTLIPDRSFLVAPPALAPPSVSAIR